MTAEDPFWIVAHRGSPTVCVENTIRSFERGVAEGANALELDLCPTKDGHIAVWHDFDPRHLVARLREWGLEPLVAHRPIVPSASRWRRPTIDLTLDELRSRYGYAHKRGGGRVPAFIPTLDDVIAWAAKRSEIGLVFLDVKIPDDHVHLAAPLIRRLDQLVEHHRPRFRIVLEGAHAKVIGELCRLTRGRRYDCSLDIQPHAGVVFDLRSCSAVCAAIERDLRHATPQKPRHVTLWPFRTHRRIVARDLARMREHNAKNPDAPIEGVCSFTINAAREMRALIDLGVHGIQSDRPGLLHRVAAACGRRVRFERPATDAATEARAPG